jgi:hypothetical protein
MDGAGRMFGWLMTLLSWAGLAVLALTFGTYALLHLINAFYFKTQNLQKRYGAKWALVTGASTGERNSRPPPCPLGGRRRRWREMACLRCVGPLRGRPGPAPIPTPQALARACPTSWPSRSSTWC